MITEVKIKKLLKVLYQEQSLENQMLEIPATGAKQLLEYALIGIMALKENKKIKVKKKGKK